MIKKNYQEVFIVNNKMMNKHRKEQLLQKESEERLISNERAAAQEISITLSEALEKNIGDLTVAINRASDSSTRLGKILILITIVGVIVSLIIGAPESYEKAKELGWIEWFNG